MVKNKMHIGTSGWSYEHWQKRFYPKYLLSKDWLKFYSQEFETVEINASFYRQMSAKTYQNWYKTTPANFVFSIKISRFITHVKKLKGIGVSWRRFIKNVRYLKNKLGPILIQLPPNFKANPDRLEKLLKLIPAKYRLALEVRNDGWYNQEVFQLLKKHKVALVFAHSGGWTGPQQLTSDFVYLRMHGSAALYSSKYSDQFLKNLAQKIKGWFKVIKTVYVYFNNDDQAYAVFNAQRLKKYLTI